MHPRQATYVLAANLSTKAKITFQKIIFITTFQYHHRNYIHRSSMEIWKSGILAAFWWYFIIHRGNKAVSDIFKLVQKATCTEIGLQGDGELWLCAAIVFWALLFFLEIHSNPSKNWVTFLGPLSLQVSLHDHLIIQTPYSFFHIATFSNTRVHDGYIIEYLYVHSK